MMCVSESVLALLLTLWRRRRHGSMHITLHVLHGLKSPLQTVQLGSDVTVCKWQWLPWGLTYCRSTLHA